MYHSKNNCYPEQVIACNRLSLSVYPGYLIVTVGSSGNRVNMFVRGVVLFYMGPTSR